MCQPQWWSNKNQAHDPSTVWLWERPTVTFMRTQKQNSFPAYPSPIYKTSAGTGAVAGAGASAVVGIFNIVSRGTKISCFFIYIVSFIYVLRSDGSALRFSFFLVALHTVMHTIQQTTIHLAQSWYNVVVARLGVQATDVSWRLVD